MRYHVPKVLTVACAAILLLAGGQRMMAQPTPLLASQSPPDFQDTASSTTLLHNTIEHANNPSLPDSFSGTFNLESDIGGITIGPSWVGLGANNVYQDYTGFTPATEQAISGSINLWIKDSDGHADSYSVDLGSTLFAAGGFSGPGGSQVTYNFTNGALSGDLLSIINTSGELSYAITDTGTGDDSDFTVDYLVLQVDTGPIAAGGSNGVPDGGSTVVLLGGVLSACLAMRRKILS